MHLQLDSITLKIERESLGALHELLDEALNNLGLFEHNTKALLAHFGKGRRSAPN